jgi:hypothetical protein
VAFPQQARDEAKNFRVFKSPLQMTFGTRLVVTDEWRGKRPQPVASLAFIWFRA